MKHKMLHERDLEIARKALRRAISDVHDEIGRNAGHPDDEDERRADALLDEKDQFEYLLKRLGEFE